MNADVKKKWVERLRSGRDRQGAGLLQSSVGLCCLGVLCEIAVEEGVIPPPRVTRGTWWYGEDEEGEYGHTSATSLPKKVQQWAELSHSPQTIEGAYLTNLNDSGRYDFEAIAHIIEGNL